MLFSVAQVCIHAKCRGPWSWPRSAAILEGHMLLMYHEPLVSLSNLSTHARHMHDLHLIVSLISHLAAGSDAFLLEALFRNEVWDFMLQPVSQGNEDALCQSMIAGCR